LKRLHAQDGFAVAIAIWLLLLGLLFGGLAMSQALLGLHKANASWNSTRAHAAAEAGARMALYAINTLGLNGASVTHPPSALDWTQCAAKADATAPMTTVSVGIGKAWCDPVPIDLGGARRRRTRCRQSSTATQRWATTRSPRCCRSARSRTA